MNKPPATIGFMPPAVPAAMLSVSFAKTVAFTYTPAVEIAQLAMFYQVGQVGKSLVHHAAFGKTPEEAARAICLVGYAGRWKSTQIYAGAQIIQNLHHVVSVLRCYLVAAACPDHHAHCCFAQDKYLVPCRLLETWFRFDSRHPSDGADQLMAAAIRRGVNWCPMYKAELAFVPDNRIRQ